MKLAAVALLAGLPGAHAVALLRGSSRQLRRADVGGNAGCPCIGISNISGEMDMVVGGSMVHYPGEVGSYCAGWDDGRNQDHCLDGQDPGKGNDWCAQRWCWVDACNCKGINAPPKRSQAGLATQGKPLYYSYATCGNEDTFTKENNPEACTNAHTEEECAHHNDGNCIWGMTNFGDKPRCVGWEASGMCPELPEQSYWGRAECPCIGFIGVNGFVDLDRHAGHTNYTAAVGSTCKAWDSDAHPKCQGKEQHDWCLAEWCLVDSAKCKTKGSFQPPWLSGMKYQGHAVEVSYETCGNEAPKRPSTTPTAPAPAPVEAPKRPSTTPTAPAPAPVAAPTWAPASVPASEEEKEEDQDKQEIEEEEAAGEETKAKEPPQEKEPEQPQEEKEPPQEKKEEPEEEEPEEVETGQPQEKKEEQPREGLPPLVEKGNEPHEKEPPQEKKEEPEEEGQDEDIAEEPEEEDKPEDPAAVPENAQEAKIHKTVKEDARKTDDVGEEEQDAVPYNRPDVGHITHEDFNHKAYNDEWHNEWQDGSYPDWKKLHPGAAKKLLR